MKSTSTDYSDCTVLMKGLQIIILVTHLHFAVFISIDYIYYIILSALDRQSRMEIWRQSELG